MIQTLVLLKFQTFSIAKRSATSLLAFRVVRGDPWRGGALRGGGERAGAALLRGEGAAGGREAAQHHLGQKQLQARLGGTRHRRQDHFQSGQ